MTSEKAPEGRRRHPSGSGIRRMLSRGDKSEFEGVSVKRQRKTRAVVNAFSQGTSSLSQHLLFKPLTAQRRDVFLHIVIVRLTVNAALIFRQSISNGRCFFYCQISSEGNFPPFYYLRHIFQSSVVMVTNCHTCRARHREMATSLFESNVLMTLS